MIKIWFEQFWSPSIILIRKQLQNFMEFQSKFWWQNLKANPSDDCRILIEFFRNFDQNSNGKDCKYPFLTVFTECVFDLSSEYLRLYNYIIFLLDSKGKSSTYKIINFRAAHLEAIYIFNKQKNWMTANLMIKKYKKISKKLCKGAEIQVGRF